MADLKSLFAAKKASPDGQLASSSNGADAPSANESTRASPSESGAGELQSAPQTAQSPAKKPANPFAKRQGNGFGDSNGQTPAVTPASSGDGSGGEQPKSGLRTLSFGAGTRDADSDTGSVAPPSLDSLDALDASAYEGVAPRERVTYFADETPATKPTRELPEGITKEQLGFVESIDSVYEIIHDPDLLGGVIRNIMIELKSNPEYMKLVAPEDVRTMVRGMRESMGLARVKKQETKAKRASGGGKKSKALDEDILAGIDELGIDLGKL